MQNYFETHEEYHGFYVKICRKYQIRPEKLIPLTLGEKICCYSVSCRVRFLTFQKEENDEWLQIQVIFKQFIIN